MAYRIVCDNCGYERDQVNPNKLPGNWYGVEIGLFMSEPKIRHYCKEECLLAGAQKAANLRKAELNKY